jgi:CubicO group peptidase (beta-lactamase class C family)
MTKKTTKRILRIVLILASVGSLYFVPWLLVKAWILPLPDTVQEQLDEAIGHGFDGMIVYVDQAGEPPQYYAAGWHNRETRIPARPDALFKIASISKLYVAVAITRLAHGGQLALDKTLADYFSELVGRIEYADRITVRMMVQHRSGIPNLTDHPGFWSDPPESKEEALGYALDQPALFEPGEDYSYSNTNYMLLGDLIDKVVGYPHYQFIQEEILTPLALNNTFPSLSAVNMDDVMSGYHKGYEPDLKADEHGMLATAEDVGIFLRALNNGSLFEAGEQEIYSSIYEYEHSGWVPGYQSFAEYDKDLDAVVIAFYSTTDSKLYNWNLSEIVNNRIFRILKRQGRS